MTIKNQQKSCIEEGNWDGVVVEAYSGAEEAMEKIFDWEYGFYPACFERVSEEAYGLLAYNGW